MEIGVSEQKITPFVFEGETTVRVCERGGKPVFVAADVCRGLGIKQAGRAIAALDADEKGVISIHTPGGEQTVLAVTEGGFYTLVLRSRRAVIPGTPAHRFRRWVMDEVLPALRRAGQAVALRPSADWRTWPEALRLRTIQEIRLTHGVKAAREAWFDSGLPVLPAMKPPSNSTPQTPQTDLFN